MCDIDIEQTRRTATDSSRGRQYAGIKDIELSFHPTSSKQNDDGSITILCEVGKVVFVKNRWGLFDVSDVEWA